MDLIHADENLKELRTIENFELWDVVLSMHDKVDDNDYQLTIPDSEWSIAPIVIGHYLYEDGTEFGGRITGVKHVGTSIQINGRTWRGMLIDKVVKPPTGEAYKTIDSMEANAAILSLLGTRMSPIFVVITENSGITVSGSFRYETLLYCLTKMLNDSGGRLEISFSDGLITLSAMPIQDLSNVQEFSQDTSDPLVSELNNNMAYNHIIALGSGDLTERLVVELYRSDDGSISSTPFADDLKNREIVLDYPTAESSEQLISTATMNLRSNYFPLESITIDLAETEGLELGDIVGGRDYVTGLAISKPITKITRTVNSQGTKIQYKVGD